MNGNVSKFSIDSIILLYFVAVLERPSSQISFLEHFLNNTSLTSNADNTSLMNDRYHRMGGSAESEEGDIEDNRIPSVESSKSNLSELSNVNVIFIDTKIFTGIYSEKDYISKLMANCSIRIWDGARLLHRCTVQSSNNINNSNNNNRWAWMLEKAACTSS